MPAGLSLDEALTYARLYLLQPGRSFHPCDWGRFMAYLPSDRTAPGTEFEIDVRGRRAKAAVVPMPFYKRPK